MGQCQKLGVDGQLVPMPLREVCGPGGGAEERGGGAGRQGAAIARRHWRSGRACTPRPHPPTAPHDRTVTGSGTVTTLSLLLLGYCLLPKTAGAQAFSGFEYIPSDYERQLQLDRFQRLRNKLAQVGWSPCEWWCCRGCPAALARACTSARAMAAPLP